MDYLIHHDHLCHACGLFFSPLFRSDAVPATARNTGGRCTGILTAACRCTGLASGLSRCPGSGRGAFAGPDCRTRHRTAPGCRAASADFSSGTDGRTAFGFQPCAGTGTDPRTGNDEPRHAGRRHAACAGRTRAADARGSGTDASRSKSRRRSGSACCLWPQCHRCCRCPSEIPPGGNLAAVARHDPPATGTGSRRSVAQYPCVKLKRP